MSAIYTIIILALFALGMPVAFVLMLGGVLGMLFFLGGPAAFTQIPVIAYKTLDDFVLVAVPLYILMSEILLKGKVGNGLFELGSKWLGHLPGGIGVATIFACAIFAAISGSSVATAVTIGAMAIPEMLKRGYERTTVLGAVAAGGTLGILIPPSIPMILYGSITGESVGKLFLSGIVPGVLMTFFFICYLVFRCRHMERQAAASWQERCLRCYIPQDADSQSRTGERMTGNQMFGHSQFASHAAYFVLEQPLQRFAQTEVHLLGQTAHVVMALDGLARNV